jgi:hypothetical protein
MMFDGRIGELVLRLISGRDEGDRHFSSNSLASDGHLLFKLILYHSTP